MKMNTIFRFVELNSSLDWDESMYNLFYQIYNIESHSDNHSSFVSTRAFDGKFEDELNTKFRFYLEGIGVLVITILGIFANCISGWILSRPQMRLPINCLFLGLAVADTFFIATNILVLALPTILTQIKVDVSFLIILTPFLFPIATTAHLASVYLTLAVTIERYIAVCHPFRARSEFTWRQATIIVIAIFIFSILYNLPRWWEYTCMAVVNKENAVTRYVPISTTLRRNPVYEKYYIYLAYFVLIYSLPLVILIVFNSLIYRTVKDANVQRRMLTASEKNETQLARMLVMVVLVFILCNAMSLVNIAAKIISGSPSIPGVDSIRNFSLTLNSCINFVIYCAYGEKFREIFVSMWPISVRKCCCRDSLHSKRFSQISRSNSSDKGRTFSISFARTTSFIIDKNKLTEATI